MARSRNMVKRKRISPLVAESKSLAHTMRRSDFMDDKKVIDPEFDEETSNDRTIPLSLNVLKGTT